MSRVVILMSTYNGEKYLKEQIDSILEQTAEDIKIDLLVRDDGSKDGTLEILENYKNDGKLNWYSGGNLGPQKSFWDLLKKSPDADYYSFADQDDVWLKDKIKRAVEAISKIKNQEQPILYCSDASVTNEKLDVVQEKMMKKVWTDFEHSMVYSIASGNTFVFNKKAKELLIRYDMNKEYPLIHDWLAHKIIVMFGEIIFDSEPSLLYRQHGLNAIGSETNLVKDFTTRAIRYLKTSDCERSKVAQSLLNTYGDEMSDEQRRLMTLFASYKNDKKAKKYLIKTNIFHTNTMRDNLLRLLFVTNKI